MKSKYGWIFGSLLIFGSLVTLDAQAFERDHPLAPMSSVDVLDYGFTLDFRDWGSWDAAVQSGLCNNKSITVQLRLKVLLLEGTSFVDLHFNTHAIRNLVVRNGRTGQLLDWEIKSFLEKPDFQYIRVREDFAQGFMYSLVFEYKFDLSQVENLPPSLYMNQLFYCGSSSLALNPYAIGFRSFAPSNDVPFDAASIEFKFLVNEDARGVGPGAILNGSYGEGVASPDGRGRLYHYRLNEPSYTSVFSFLVGTKKREIIEAKPFKSVTGRKIPVLFFSSGSEEILESMKEVAAWMEARVAPYYPASSKIAFQNSGGGMEYTTLILGAIVHEMVHEWWGNAVRPKHFGDGWISEGFTTYYTYLFDEWKAGRKPEEGKKFPACSVENPCSKLNGHWKKLNLIYDGGARALHRLRVLMSELSALALGSEDEDRRFHQFMSSYYLRFVGQAVSSEEFVGFVKKELPVFLKAHRPELDVQQIETALGQWRADFFSGFEASPDPL